MPGKGKKNGELMRAPRLPSPLTKKPAATRATGQFSLPGDNVKKKNGATPSSAPSSFPPQQEGGDP